MTGKQAFELVKQHHPVMPLGQFLMYLNEGQKDLCRKAELYKTSYVQDSSAGTRYYTLHDNILDIKDVHFNDVSIPRLIGNPIIDDDEFQTSTNSLATPSVSSNERYWYLDNNRLGIVEKGSVTRDGKTSKYQSCSVSDVEIRVICTSYPTEIQSSDLEQVLLEDVQGAFENVIVDYVIMKGYTLPTSMDSNAFALFKMQYNEGVKEAKKYARKGTGSSGYIKSYDF